MFDVRSSRMRLLPFIAGAGLALPAWPAPPKPAPRQASTAKAPEARLTVDAKGALRVTAPVLRKLKAQPARGMICLQFPLAPRKHAPQPRRPVTPGTVAPGDHEHELGAPPRVWVAVRQDGSVVLRRTRIGPGQIYLPGGPGTAYLATAYHEQLLLRRPGQPIPEPYIPQKPIPPSRKATPGPPGRHSPSPTKR